MSRTIQGTYDGHSLELDEPVQIEGKVRMSVTFEENRPTPEERRKARDVLLGPSPFTEDDLRAMEEGIEHFRRWKI